MREKIGDQNGNSYFPVLDSQLELVVSSNTLEFDDVSFFKEMFGDSQHLLMKMEGDLF